MRMALRILLLCGLAPAALAQTGCTKKPTGAKETAPQSVTVSKPIQRDVTDYVDFTGRTDAIISTEIRPRVTGYLTKMPFKEGSVVKKDELLFEIDDRPYKAALDLAKATLVVAKASLVKAQADYDIGLNVQKQSAGAISQQELNKRLGARDEAAGNVQRAQAELENALLNFDWCKVKAPADGQVSRYQYTLGNLVNQNQTVLTTVVSQDPMYVYFDVDENNMLDILRKLVLPSKVDVMAEKDGVPVLMGLADETGFPHKGFVNFSNNIVNPSTGTITLRGVFDNPGNEVGKRLLRPGMFVRVRLPIGKPHPALLVCDQAIGTDQSNKYLLIVDDKNKVDYQRITPGPLQDDGLRVIAGIKADEWIIVNGLQLVRPGVEVKLDPQPMPESNAQSIGAGKATGPASANQKANPASGGAKPAPATNPGNTNK
ncbi:multidrug efflux RND transporter periplasmic adaptor subunit MexE [soil metagenome]